MADKDELAKITSALGHKPTVDEIEEYMRTHPPKKKGAHGRNGSRKRAPHKR